MVLDDEKSVPKGAGRLGGGRGALWEVGDAFQAPEEAPALYALIPPPIASRLLLGRAAIAFRHLWQFSKHDQTSTTGGRTCRLVSCRRRQMSQTLFAVVCCDVFVSLFVRAARPKNLPYEASLPLAGICCCLVHRVLPLCCSPLSVPSVALLLPA